MATAEQLRKSIEPGSTEYGDRQRLEQGLAQVASGPSQPGAQGGTGGRATPAAAPPGPEDPLGALLSGEIEPEDTPPTDGLSVGPGRGPSGAANESIWNDDYTQRLRYVAQFAKTPMLRAQARAALRYRVRGGDVQ